MTRMKKTDVLPQRPSVVNASDQALSQQRGMVNMCFARYPCWTRASQPILPFLPDSCSLEQACEAARRRSII